MNNKDILKIIKDYIKEGVEQSVKIFGDFQNRKFLAGKIAAYNDVYDYIENVLEGEVDNHSE